MGREKNTPGKVYRGWVRRPGGGAGTRGNATKRSLNVNGWRAQGKNRPKTSALRQQAGGEKKGRGGLFVGKKTNPKKRETVPVKPKQKGGSCLSKKKKK